MKAKSRAKGILWRGLGFLLSGLLAFVCYWVFQGIQADHQEFEEKGILTQGTVVNVVRGSASGESGNNSAEYVVQFFTPEGKSVTFGEESAFDLGLSQGQNVPVKYLEAKPTYARIQMGKKHHESPRSLWMVGGLGIGLVLLGLGFLRSIWRQLKPSPKPS